VNHLHHKGSGRVGKGQEGSGNVDFMQRENQLNTKTRCVADESLGDTPNALESRGAAACTRQLGSEKVQKECFLNNVLYVIV
jgi:hypothetical protein